MTGVAGFPVSPAAGFRMSFDIHGHRWASEPTMPGPGTAGIPGGAHDTAPLGGGTISAPAPGNDHDNGLVHGHAWAVQSPDR
jgi:hypothetical protein